MIDEAKKTRIGELREEGVSVREIANTLNISQSTVKRHSSDNYEKDNELDEKTSNEMTKIMLLEGYEFEDEIKPLIYALKNQANELDITLWDYVNDFKNNNKRFLRISEKPIRLYYIFMLFASNLNLITEHISPEKIIEAVDNFIEREVSMEKAEDYIATCDVLLEEKYEKWQEKILNAEEEYNEYRKRIQNTKREAISEVESKSELLLKNTKQDLKEYREKIDNAQKELASIILNQAVVTNKDKTENQDLRKLLEQTNKEKLLLEKIFMRIGAVFPEEVKSIVSEIENEQL